MVAIALALRSNRKTTLTVQETFGGFEIPRMNKKFGAGKQPIGTPSLGWSSVVVIVSLLAGASVVHNIYKPDLTLPSVESVDVAAKKQTENQ